MENVTVTGSIDASATCGQLDGSKVVYLIIVLVFQMLLVWCLYAKYFQKEKKQIVEALNEAFISYEARYKSFDNCNVVLTQYVCNLCEAGFFYTGDGQTDGVACFSCNIQLRDWEIHDNAWVQHARWSKDCSFLHLCKGKSFVDRVQNVYDITAIQSEESAANRANMLAEVEQLVRAQDQMMLANAMGMADNEISVQQLQQFFDHDILQSANNYQYNDEDLFFREDHHLNYINDHNDDDDHHHQD